MSDAVGSKIPTKYYKILDPIQFDKFSINNVIVSVVQLKPDDDGDIEDDNLLGIGFRASIRHAESSEQFLIYQRRKENYTMINKDVRIKIEPPKTAFDNVKIIYKTVVKLIRDD